MVQKRENNLGKVSMGFWIFISPLLIWEEYTLVLLSERSFHKTPIEPEINIEDDILVSKRYSKETGSLGLEFIVDCCI